jgi:hypothetical protein
MKQSLLAKRESLCKIVLLPVRVGINKISSLRPVSSSRLLLLFLSFLFCTQLLAQPDEQAKKEAEYKKVLTERSVKIVNTLGITDSVVYHQVKDAIVNQYIQLNAVHEKTKAAVATVKTGSLSEEEKKEAVAKEEEKKSSALLQLHDQFISLLKKNLKEEQLEKLKNGMTYNVLNVTYTAYLDMILTLTELQKRTIYNWLVEAREKAMDEGSSEDKHKVFGKYKGRVNNYLSAEGYDMKAEEKAWQQRLREKREKEAAEKKQQSS